MHSNGFKVVEASYYSLQPHRYHVFGTAQLSYTVSMKAPDARWTSLTISRSDL